MSKALVRAAFVAVLVMGTLLTIGCGKTKEGQLPTYNVGDKWSYEAVIGGSEYSTTSEVTGDGSVNGRDCWIIEETISPGLVGLTSATSKYDKSNLYVIRGQGSGTIQGQTLSFSSVYSYQPSDASYFPLEVGREVTVTETMTTTTTVAGRSQTKTETTIHNYKVEAVVEITVQAGTFKCFKITDGNSTTWYSDKAKQEVKRIEADGSTMELTSYSV